MPCAEAVSDKGHDVRGYDVVNYDSKKVLMCKNIYTCVHDRDICLLYTSPSPRDRTRSRMPSSA